jgi:hypothetical protein
MSRPSNAAVSRSIAAATRRICASKLSPPGGALPVGFRQKAA